MHVLKIYFSWKHFSYWSVLEIFESFEKYFRKFRKVFLEVPKIHRTMFECSGNFRKFRKYTEPFVSFLEIFRSFKNDFRKFRKLCWLRLFLRSGIFGNSEKHFIAHQRADLCCGYKYPPPLTCEGCWFHLQSFVPLACSLSCSFEPYFLDSSLHPCLTRIWGVCESVDSSLCECFLWSSWRFMSTCIISGEFFASSFTLGGWGLLDG